jgi:hypothetical protein
MSVSQMVQALLVSPPHSKCGCEECRKWRAEYWRLDRFVRWCDGEQVPIFTRQP